jgi:hypothetical protein
MTFEEFKIGMVVSYCGKLVKILEIIDEPDDLLGRKTHTIKWKYLKTGYKNQSRMCYGDAHGFEIPDMKALLSKHRMAVRSLNKAQIALDEIKEALGPYELTLAEEKIKTEISKPKKRKHNIGAS